MNLYLALRLRFDAARLEELARTDPDFDTDTDGLCPLARLLWYNEDGSYTKAIMILLDRGARVNHVNVHGNCALVFCRNRSDFNMLISRGADVDLVAPVLPRLDITDALFEAGLSRAHPVRRRVQKEVGLVVLASPRLCEDLARLVVELTQ